MKYSHADVANKPLGASIFDNNPKLYKFLKKRAEEMKMKPTLAEMRLSNILDSIFVKYEFQKVIPPYIADFVIMKKKLIIEIDGDHHDTNIDQQSHDSKRDEFLNSLGFMVLRFNNKDILEKPIPVINHILIYNPKYETKHFSQKIKEHEYKYLSYRTSRKAFYFYFKQALKEELHKIFAWRYGRCALPY